MKTVPAVFTIGEEYQIMVPVNKEVLMWVEAGNHKYYDESNGIIRSKTEIHRMRVPAEVLDKAGKYKICWREVIERKPYFTETKGVCEEEFDFFPVKGGKIVAYQIADAHNTVKGPVLAAKAFEKEYGALDFLILNGDIPIDSGKIENFDTIYEIVAQITNGNIPVVFSRGNHDTRGIFAEKIAEYTPCENGNSYFHFKLGDIFGIVLDSGEDKDDSCDEYGNTVCCNEFRLRETKFLENLLETKEKEYNSDKIKYKIVVMHNPVTLKKQPPFDIEEELFSYWSKILREKFSPNVMICGHTHKLAIEFPGDENDVLGHACPVVTGSRPIFKENYFAGSGFIFENDKITVVFNDSEKVLKEMVL